MNRKQAKEVAMGLNIKPGETITFQGTGQIENSHQHNRSDTGPSHEDGWLDCMFHLCEFHEIIGEPAVPAPAT